MNEMKEVFVGWFVAMLLIGGWAFYMEQKQSVDPAQAEVCELHALAEGMNEELQEGLIGNVAEALGGDVELAETLWRNCDG